MKEYQAVAYLRLSVAGSRAIESESIENQEYIIARFVEENPDIELAFSYADSGHSDLIFERPAFSEMMQAAKEGKINCIIVKDLSRFGCDYIETGRYLQQILPSLGIRFIAILDHVDTLHTPPINDIVMQIKTLINDEFSREISVRTRSSLQTMRQSGFYVGACPIYGYQKSVESRNALVPDHNATPVVKRIFDMKLFGMSAAKITAKLNADGIPSPLVYKRNSGMPHAHHGFADRENAKWSASTVLRILKDETYTGTLVQGKQYKLNYKIQKYITRPSNEWVRYPNAHEAIVSLQDFETVRRILLLDTRTSPGGDVVNLFSGLLICGSCGGNMTRKTVRHGDTVYRYYYCTTGKRKGCVSPVMIPENVLEAAVFKEIRQYIEKVREVSKELENLTGQEVIRLLTKEKLDDIEVKRVRLQKLRDYRASLRISEIRGILSTEESSEMDAAYAQEIQTLENKMDEATLQIQMMSEHLDMHVSQLNNIANLVSGQDLGRLGITQVLRRIAVSMKHRISLEFILNIQVA